MTKDDQALWNAYNRQADEDWQREFRRLRGLNPDMPASAPPSHRTIISEIVTEDDQHPWRGKTQAQLDAAAEKMKSQGLPVTYAATRAAIEVQDEDAKVVQTAIKNMNGSQLLAYHYSGELPKKSQNLLDPRKSLEEANAKTDAQWRKDRGIK